jgi:hypothetical protein
MGLHLVVRTGLSPFTCTSHLNQNTYTTCSVSAVWTHDIVQKERVVLYVLNALNNKRVFCIYIQLIPRSKHSLSRMYKPIQLMLYEVKVAVCCKIHTKHISNIFTI